MVLFEGALGLIALGVWIFCIIDVITTPSEQVRNLPKLAWIFIVLLLVDIGSVAWLFAGRPWTPRSSVQGGGRLTSGTRKANRPSNPDDDEEFLAGLKARAEEQRRRAGEASGDDQPGGSTPSA